LVTPRLKAISFLIAFAATLAFAAETRAANTLVISEFMALNNSTVRDEDGTYSDWIEIHNASSNSVNLGGWYLTGNPTNLTRWQFPATNLGPGAFLIVFASDKDRRIPGAPLHTNFKLGGSGEYLALVLPDGVTKASEFAPAYPQQYADISYGYVMTGAVTTIVASNDPVRALVPTADIGASWQLPGFNDAAWTSGVLGVGYDTSGGYASAIGLNLQGAMLNLNASAYARVPFTVANPAAFKSLNLGLRYDDGFIAYLNGGEVLRRNAPLSPAWNSAATAAHGTPNVGLLVENFEGSSANFVLNQYAAGPAPGVQPAGAGSTGKFLRLLHDGTNGAANGITFRQTAPGLFQTIVADFDFRITSSVNNPADGFCFLLIPTAIYGTNGPGVNIPTQAAEEPNYPNVFAIGFDVYPHSVRNDVSAHWNGAEAANVTIPTATLDLASGVFHHAHVRLEHVSGGALVTLTLTRNINGTPGGPFTAITNFFIGGLNAFDCRVQFGGRTGGLNLGLDLDNCNIQFLPPGGPVAFEDFDITPSLGQLVAGTNLLAIHGLNISPGNSNFLIQPRLLGRDLVVTEPATYLYPPTPGAWNESAGSSVLPPPVTFTPAPGAYASNTLAVTLYCSSSSATIRYTLDGSTPGTGSPVYSNAIVISTNATIRARAEIGAVPSQVTAANYVLLDPSVTNFSSNLPLVIIDTLRQPIPDGSKIVAYAVFIDTNAPPGRTRLTGSNDHAGQLGIELHGSSSLGFPKKTFSIELDDEGGKALNRELLGLPAGSDWLLYPSYNDKTLMNNVLSHELFGAMGHYAIRCKYTELFLRTTQGKLTANDYQGIYVLMERIRVESNRVDLATLNPTDNAPPDVTGGYLFSRDKINANDLLFTTTSGQTLIALHPKADKITQPQLGYLTGYINAFEAALYGPNWRDPLSGYAAFIDVDSFVDFHWVVEYPKNIDGVRISNFLHKDRNGKITAGPIWDWDLSWGNADYAEGGKTNDWYYPLMSEPDDMWLRRLRTDPDFYQKIIDRWGALRLNLFHPTNIFARTDQITNHLWEAQTREFVAWPRLGTYVWPNPNGAAGGWDVDYVNPTTYTGIIGQFKKFVSGRYLWIDKQFVPAPELDTNGNTLTFSAPLGSIYFTLDGTDPRGSGGGINPGAQLYSSAVTLTNNSAIFARAFHTNAWSAPARAVYVAVLPSLRITEINFHPLSPPFGSLYDDRDFEFIEIRNTGTNVINLAGARLGGGINFTFAPNELVPVGAVTSNSFDGGGTPLTASTLGQPPGAALVSDGPGGILLRLLNSNTNATRNRVTFNQTASGNYDRLIADFDFRAATSVSNSVSGAPTIQNFDVAGTTYTLSQAGPTAPVVQPADAGSTGNYLRIVPASGGELGVIAFNRTATGAFNSIVTTFDFRITPPSEGNQADGLGFALLSTANYGNSGAGPAFGEQPNLTGSIGIGFDAFNNGPNPAEPNNNHVSLHWNNAQIGNAATPSFDMSNGRFHRAQVIVWFSGGNAYLTVRLTPDINGVPGPTETVLANALIPGAAPYQARAAFGARTGGLWAAHDLDNLNVEFTANAAAAAGLSLLGLPAAQFGTTGVGTTLTHFTDLPLVTNVLALDLTFNPSNLVNDVAIYWNAALAASISLPASTLNLDAGFFHHARLQLDAVAGGVYAAVTLVPDSLGAPGTPINVFSNLFIPGAILGSGRLEFAGRNGGLAARVDLENVLASFQVLAPMLLNPGESIVVVRNFAAFVSRYGNLIRVAGEYSGSLADEGERLTLLGPLGEPILDFNYDPTWYPITDGGGYSLVVVDPNASTGAWGAAQNWRPSGQPGGSPGADDSAPPAILVISSSGADTLSIAWPVSAGALQLYSAAALTPPVEWNPIPNAPALSNDQWVVIVSPLTNAACFYRLQGQ
jgi:hypothetical protein